MKKLKLKKIIESIIKEINFDVEDVNYTLRYPNNDILIKLNINKVLKRQLKDEPEFAITSRKSPNIMSQSKIDNAKEYWINYAHDQRWLHPNKTGKRSLFPDMTFEPSIIMFDINDKLGFTDGRHRLIAMKELDYTHAMFEIPKSQINMFKKFK